MTTATVTHPPGMEAANFLNLLVVDEVRAIRDACREVVRSQPGRDQS